MSGRSTLVVAGMLGHALILLGTRVLGSLSMETWQILGWAWWLWLPALVMAMRGDGRKDAAKPPWAWLHFDSPKELGIEEKKFFIEVLRACPDGAKLDFAWSEPESFVEQFRPWSHRQNVSAYEADYYIIDREFVSQAGRLSNQGRLEIDHHFSIGGPSDEPLIQSFDDFTVIAMTEPFFESLCGERRAAV